MHDGVRGYLGNLDMTQIGWLNCPSAQKGQHTGKSGVATLGVELVSDGKSTMFCIILLFVI